MKQITRDPQIIKFGMYGFFKNLRFFEPFLYVYLLGSGLDLINIGLLISIREIVVYVLEIPTGIYADRRGKKEALIICFISYMISFAFFFAGSGFPVFAAAMIFFGCGEAFRSGTHKAIIYTYLEKRGWFNRKTMIYGRTRAFSLAGTAVSSITAALFAISKTELRFIFILTIVPYILDLILISTYPADLNEKFTETHKGMFFKDTFLLFRRMFSRKNTIRLLADSSIFDAAFKSLKDYVQPAILMVFAVTAQKGNSFTGPGITLAAAYALFAIAGSFSSFNAHRLTRSKGQYQAAHLLMFFFGAALTAAGLFTGLKIPAGIIICYLLLNSIYNCRRPVLVAMFGDEADRDSRATLLSVDSQFRSLLTAAAAPLLGYIAETYSLAAVFFITGSFLILFSLFFRKKNSS